jgi:hypothetical protein
MSTRRLLAPLAVALAAAVLVGTANGARPLPDPADEAARASLRHANAQLRQELALSAKKEFYLRLDAGRGTLALVLRGVMLGEHRIARLEIGEPRIAFVRRGLPEDWDVAPLSGGELDPPREHDRIEIVAPEPPASADRPGTETIPSLPPLPATAEESYSVPLRYRIVFREGVTIEIRSPGGARNRSGLQRIVDAASLWLHDRVGAVCRSGKDQVRLRVELAAEDAATLYRSLPPAVRLVILGPIAD